MSTVGSIEFGSGKRRGLIIVETAIYRVFVMIYRIFSDLEFSSKNLNRTILTVGCDARDV